MPQNTVLHCATVNQFPNTFLGVKTLKWRKADESQFFCGGVKVNWIQTGKPEKKIKWIYIWNGSKDQDK